MKITTIALLLLVAFPLVADENHNDQQEGEHDDAVARLVAQQYPADLTAYAQARHLKEVKSQAFVTLEIANSKYVVASYSNGHIGAVTLLERSTSDTYSVDQAIIGRKMQGSSPSVKAIDVDGDGAPEVVVTFALPRGAQTWIYRVSNRHLELISPTADDGGSLLQHPSIVDTTGKGVKDIIQVSSLGRGEDGTLVFDRYVLQNGKYVAATPLDFYHVFYVGKKEKKVQTVEFPIPQSLVGKPFKFAIINGDSSGEKYRVDAVGLTLNGVKVTSEDDSGEERGTWTIPITLHETNTLSVTLNGNSRARVGIAVLHN